MMMLIGYPRPASSSASSNSSESPPTVLPDELDFNSFGPLSSDAVIANILSTEYDPPNPQSLVYSIEDQASSFFFHHFVSKGNLPPTGYASFVPALFNHQSCLGSASNPLPGIITAIGMAGLSNMQSSSAGMVATRQKHTGVLRALNAALQDPGTASADSTLMSVMLLGTFEV